MTVFKVFAKFFRVILSLTATIISFGMGFYTRFFDLSIFLGAL
jgi:hypothetical protein